MPIVVGVPRSGTTLLRMMLDAHSALAIPPETGFLPPLAELPSAGDAPRAAWELVTGFHTWPDFHLDPLALRERLVEAATPADVARTFYRLYAARFGKARWGDKTPAYGTEIDRIARLLPEARFVHIIRDGRDVLLSVRDMWFRPGDTVEACARDWVARLDRTRALGATLDGYLEVRYEALVLEPARTLETICRFLDLPFEPAMLAYHARAGTRLDEHEARYASDGRLILSKSDRRRNQQLVMEPPRRDRIGRWRHELSGEELARFDAVAGEWLEHLGYPRVPM